MKDTCATCRWFKSYGNYYGDCKRRAPEVSATTEYARFPRTADADWCGEYALNAEARKQEIQRKIQGNFMSIYE